jgi:hypothetical protein
MLFSDPKCCLCPPATTQVAHYVHYKPMYEGWLSGSGNGVEYARGLGRVVCWLDVGACE